MDVLIVLPSANIFQVGKGIGHLADLLVNRVIKTRLKTFDEASVQGIRVRASVRHGNEQEGKVGEEKKCQVGEEKKCQVGEEKECS